MSNASWYWTFEWCDPILITKIRLHLLSSTLIYKFSPPLLATPHLLTFCLGLIPPPKRLAWWKKSHNTILISEAIRKLNVFSFRSIKFQNLWLTLVRFEFAIDGPPRWSCQPNENSTLSTQFTWRESIELAGVALCAPCVDGAKFGFR